MLKFLVDVTTQPLLGFLSWIVPSGAEHTASWWLCSAWVVLGLWPRAAHQQLETDIQANQCLVPGGTMYTGAYIHTANDNYEVFTTTFENFCLPARFCTPKKFQDPSFLKQLFPSVCCFLCFKLILEPISIA